MRRSGHDVANLFAELPERPPEEVIEILAAGDRVRIERIVSRGHASPEGFWYDQAEREWVALLRGGATLILRDPDETIDLAPGDHLLIEAHRPHRVEATSPHEETIWLTVFFPP